MSDENSIENTAALACYFFCCYDLTTDIANDFAKETLEGLISTLRQIFFPISEQDFSEIQSGAKDYYRPLKKNKASLGLAVKKLKVGISKGLKQVNGGVRGISKHEEYVIRAQLIHSIIVTMLTEETQFNYNEDLISSQRPGRMNAPNYRHLHQDETERFLESIRSFPNGSQVDLRTENSVEHKALDIHIAKAISTALDKLDITEAVVTSINTFRSDNPDEAVSDTEQLTEMFKPSGMSRI
jgi:hypothetical protein